MACVISIPLFITIREKDGAAHPDDLARVQELRAQLEREYEARVDHDILVGDLEIDFEETEEEE